MANPVLTGAFARVDPVTAARGSIDAVLKDFYEGPVREQLNSDTLLMSRLSRNTEVVDGRRVIVPVHTGRNRGIQAVIEGGLIPTPGRQAYEDMEFLIKFMYGAIRITGPAMASSRTDEGSFIRGLQSELQGMVRDFKLDLNRMSWADGSGRLAVIDTARVGHNPAGGVYGVRQVWDSGNQAANAVRWLHVGDRIAVHDISAVVANQIVGLDTNDNLYEPVIAVDMNANTITTAAPVAAFAVANGDAIVKGPDEIAVDQWDTNFRGGAAGPVPLDSKEHMGLVGICNGPNGFPEHAFAPASPAWNATGSVYATHNGAGAGNYVSAPLQGWHDNLWAANMFFAGGVPRALTPDLMQQGFDASEEIGQAVATIGLCSYAVRRRYVDLLTPDRRYVGANTYEMDGGYKAVDYNGIPIVPEKDCPEATLFFLSEPNIAYALMSDFYWLDKDGAILKWVDRRDAWEAVMAWYAEMYTDRRNAHSVIGDILI